MTAPDPHPRPHLVEGSSGQGPGVPDPSDHPLDPQQLRRRARRARRAAWRGRFNTALPMRLALGLVASVWAVGAVWSYGEQTGFGVAKLFAHPALLPLALDGFAVAMATLAFAASLDGRPAIPARLATVVGAGLSAASNGVWAAQRSNGDIATIVISVCIPIIANVAFETLLSEVRRRVQRSRGMPPPVVLPTLRIVRLLLAPVETFGDWRSEVLALTATSPRLIPDTSGDVPGDVSELPSLEEAAATLFEVAPNVSRDRLQAILRTNTYWAKKFHGQRPGAVQ